LLERWLEWVEAALNGSASNDNYVFILEISFLLWWLAYLGVWTVLRHGHVWRGVLLAGVAILVNTYYAPQPVNGLLVSFCITAMILLAWTNMVSHRQRWRFQRIRFNQDIGFDFMRNGVLYALVVISLAFITPNLGRNLQFHQWLDPINQRWEAATGEWNRLYQGINRQSIPVQAAAFGRSLTLGGERNVTERPVLQVSANQGRYWRAVAFDTFTGRQWLNTATDEIEYDANQPIPIIEWAERRPMTQTVTLLAPGGNVIFGAPDIRLASIPIAGLLTPILSTDVDEEVMPDQAELTWSRAQINLEEGSSYTIISNHTEVTVRAMREAEGDYPPQILDRYLQLPENFSSRVADLAAEVTGAETTVYDKAKALESYLRSNYTYNEEIAAPAPEQDPVEYFLFEIGEGYCDYYATSMAVMLRSLGIPARTASGYAEGTYDRESSTYIITERDAHTWVEVYFPGYGWVEFEPTAGESVLNRPSGIDPVEGENFSDPAQNYPQGDQPMMDDFMNEQFNNADQFDPGFFEDAQTRARNNWIWISIGLTLVALLGGGWLLRRRLYQGPDNFEAEPPNLFYERLLNWVQRLGMATQTGETPYERADVLSQQIPTGTPFIRRITDIYVLHRFAPRRLLGNQDTVQSELAQNWQLLQPILWRTWLQKRIDRLRPRRRG
jgi:transglutaminase-like putative cysteine protease